MTEQRRPGKYPAELRDRGGGRSDESLTIMTGVHDPSVLDVDPRGQVVGEAKAVGGAERIELSGLKMVRGWGVVVADAEIHRHPHYAGHGLGGDP